MLLAKGLTVSYTLVGNYFTADRISHQKVYAKLEDF